MHYTLAYLLFLLLFTAWACTWVTSLDSIMHTYSFAESAWNDKNISALTTPRATVDNTDGSLFVIFQSLPQLLQKKSVNGQFHIPIQLHHWYCTSPISSKSSVFTRTIFFPSVCSISLLSFHDRLSCTKLIEIPRRPNRPVRPRDRMWFSFLARSN